MENFIVEDYIGYEIEEVCPDCGRKLYECKHGDKWCGNCGWANTEEFTKWWRETFGVK